MGFVRAIYFWVNFWTFTSYQFIKLMMIRLRYLGKGTEELSLATHSLACDWGKGIIRYTPGWHYEVEGQENLPKKVNLW